MRIYMQKAANEQSAPRFLHLFIQKDLIEGWCLVQVSGLQGSAGRSKLIHYTSREEAEKSLIEKRDAQLKKGYQVVFLEGTYF